MTIQTPGSQKTGCRSNWWPPGRSSRGSGYSAACTACLEPAKVRSGPAMGVARNTGKSAVGRKGTVLQCMLVRRPCRAVQWAFEGLRVRHVCPSF